ncbi:CPBP family intramembrane metalloprotease [Clostridioides sp. ZZV14-6009]|uniref:CPBP family glutamic-type intramembrane protease n=1 Tax=Clostridioides sp. ZZV14-6009 TaxID=2811487 RepID=UPI001D100E85|nr:CPBP family intramembrane metalloprotease [Clostridioides sp. ZZV14-6009]
MNFSNIKKYFLNFCGAILVSLLIVFVYLIASAFESTNKLFSNQTINSMSTFIISFIIVFVLAKVYNEGILEDSYKKLSIKSFLNYDKKYISLTLSLLIISIVFCKILALIIYDLTQEYGSDTELSLAIFISSFTYVPFIEELIFRGMFFNIASNLLDMKNNTVIKITIIVNLITFLIMHYTSFGFPNFNLFLSLLASILPRVVISASLIYIYIKTKDIKYDIILHMLYNFIIIIINSIF